MPMVAILGIHDGHNSGATLVVDGAIVASISEERLTRRKNEVGYPTKSIERVLKIGSIDLGKLTSVVYSSNYMHETHHLENFENWYVKDLQDQRTDFAKNTDSNKTAFQSQESRRRRKVEDHLGVDSRKVKFVEHHLAHVAAAHFTSPDYQPGKAYLGLTCDGSGDGVSATVSICRDNTVERIASTDRHASLGKIYSRVTFLMGMKPWEHEYKLMGMAPYSDPERNDKAAEPLRQLLRLDDSGLRFALGTELSTNYCYNYLLKNFERIRFDTICGATQLHTEELLVQWVKNCVAHTGISDIVAGGGVFMNVKANMLLGQLPEVTSLYVMPSGGDESLSFGAALLEYYQLTAHKDHEPSKLFNLYLGDTSTKSEEKEAIQHYAGRISLEVEEPADVPRRVSDLLANNEIVANCRGRMEWGARALGNRSILTSANNYGRVDEINQMIKMRDFWMPFAPSIRAEAADRYFDNPKQLKAWFMTLAFPSKPESYSDLRAGSHPRDKTIRPQVVRQQENPDYHKIITGFEGKTGRGVVLNTSFNLHGEPIVDTAGDALRVLELSGLKYIALNNFIVRKLD